MCHWCQTSSRVCCLASGSWHAVKVTKGNKGETRGHEEERGKNDAPAGRMVGGPDKQSGFRLSFSTSSRTFGCQAQGEGDRWFIHPFTQQTLIECLLCAWLGALRWRSSDRGETVFLHKRPQRLGWVKPTRPINVIESGQCHERVIPRGRGPTHRHLAAGSQHGPGRGLCSGWFGGGDR